MSYQPLVRRSAEWRDAVALTLLAFIVYLVRIGTRSLTFDEATSVVYARLSLSSLLPVLTGGDPNMSLYYVLLHFWVGIFGESESAVRSLSAILAALAVATVYRLGARLFGRTVGLVAGFLLSLNAFVVQYAQTARTYALLLLLAALSSYLFVDEIERPSRRGRIAYVVVSTLALYAHYFAAYVFVVHGVTILAIKRREALTRAWVRVGAAILLLCVPAMIFASRAGPERIIGWIEQPPVADLWSVLVDLSGGSEMVLLMLLAGGVYALVSACREPRWWPHGFVGAWLAVPIALAFGASFAQPMFISYYLIISVPALVLFGAATVKVWRPAAAAAFVAPLVWLSITQLTAFNPPDRAENWRDSTGYILAGTQPGDAIVFFPLGARKPFEYYERQQGVTEPVNPARPPRADSGRIWFVIRESDVAAGRAEVAEIRSSLTERYRLADRRQFRRVGVELYVR